jgi:hypothetical protein
LALADDPHTCHAAFVVDVVGEAQPFRPVDLVCPVRVAQMVAKPHRHAIVTLPSALQLQLQLKLQLPEQERERAPEPPLPLQGGLLASATVKYVGLEFTLALQAAGESTCESEGGGKGKPRPRGRAGAGARGLAQ